MNDTTPLIRVLPNEMKNSQYSISVWQYLMGQFRIQIEDHNAPTLGPEGHGSVVVELDTYKKKVLEKVIQELQSSESPLKYTEGLKKPWNSDFPNDRIRLDNVSADRPNN